MTISPDNQKLFESMGVDAVRIDLLSGFEGNVKIPRGPARDEAKEWLGEEERKQRRRERLMLGLTVVAAVAASIAAWPIIKDWLW
jgi:hypothetical protein